jgi:CBS domain-containing protein
VNALPPLLIAAVVAYAFTVLVMKRSILTEKVARRGFDIFREYEVDPLEKCRIAEAMSKTVVYIPGDCPATDLYGEYFSRSAKNRYRGYPVLDKSGQLLGVLTAADILADSSPKKGEIHTAADLIKNDPIVAFSEETCREAAIRMASGRVGCLPIVSREDQRKVIGFLTRGDLLKPHLSNFEDETKYERHLAF